MRGVPVFTKAVGWVRADYPQVAPGGHVAIVALCCKRRRSQPAARKRRAATSASGLCIEPNHNPAADSAQPLA